MLVHKPRRCLSLDKKLLILKEAFPINGDKPSLRQVARNYKVQTSQIRRWRETLERKIRDMESSTCLRKSMFRVKSTHFTRLPGSRHYCSFKNKNLVEHLKKFYDNKRERNEKDTGKEKKEWGKKNNIRQPSGTLPACASGPLAPRRLRRRP